MQTESPKCRACGAVVKWTSKLLRSIAIFIIAATPGIVLLVLILASLVIARLLTRH